MKQVTAAGQSVEDAVSSALAQLNTTRDRVEIEVVDQGKKGFFGWIGARKAVVHASLLPDPVEEACQFLKNISEKMNVHSEITVKREGKVVTFHLSGEKIALLIGKRGQTLNSLQYLTQLVANRHSKQYITIVVDAEGYRQRRKDTLIQLAERMADKAHKSGKEVSLEPMPSYERKILHNALLKNPKIKTTSSGAEPFRHVIISPKNKA